MSSNADGAQPARPTRNVEVGLFLVGLVSLMTELLHTRMLAFFLGSISSFLAIPVALLGLAVGSLLAHRKRSVDVRHWVAPLQVLVLPVLTATFVGFFAVANAFFPIIHVSIGNPYGDAARVLAYAGIFLPSYVVFGALLALYLDEGAHNIGRLYFFDLAGAASGCVVAPLVLTWAGLPPAILTVLLGALVLPIVAPPRRSPSVSLPPPGSVKPIRALPWRLIQRRIVVAAAAAGYGTIALLALRESIFRERPDVARLSRYALSDQGTTQAHEARVRWNDLARTSLVRAQRRTSHEDDETWGIVQDDGISNVKVARWDPEAKPDDILPASLHHTLPFLMGWSPKRILVLFAGVGRDMVELDGMAGGSADITGVELNPLVAALSRDPLLAKMNLRAFHARPNIHLVVREGRDYLNSDRGRYDLLFVATNGSIQAGRTGHTRKYLDTYEAMASYLDHLAPSPGSMMIFVNQPVLHKAESLRQLFAERGLGDFSRAVFAFGSPETRGQDSMVVKPGGLTRAEIAALERKLASWPHPRRVLYSPAGVGLPRFADAVLGRTRGPLVTDDRPFVHEVRWRDFELLPARERFDDQLYASSWIKVFTLLLFAVVSVAVMALVSLGVCLGRGRERRVPGRWVLYFFVSGVSYMCVQIGLIAKTELLLGRPLYAVAVILALFLASNGLGAYLQHRLRVFRSPATLVLPAVAAIAWSLLAVHLCNALLLSLPLPLKLICVALAVVPAGTLLGVFYPLGVERVVATGRRAAVPATYAMATLSSVWGSAWAMTAITNLGFSTVILIGAAGYVLSGTLAFVARNPSPA